MKGRLHRANSRRRDHSRPAKLPRAGLGPLADGLAPFRDLRGMRRLIAVVALLLAAYCLIVATSELSAQPAPDRPDPQALAARERHLWPGVIPVVFLGLAVGYAVLIAARRRRRTRPSPVPSTQDPPTAMPASSDRHGDTPSP